MAYIKKLVIYGFKSFPRKTEVPFTPEINVILGPNGSGKSNISDALCFVLGRLGIKSMRATKARNLIFLGTKAASPAKEAMVEIVFDNSDKIFSIDEKEISIKRIVRRNGQSIYKINNKTKKRHEVLLLLAQAGIDSNGFNIILQGEIHNFAIMHSEERRKIIEEVSGIAIYESRKEKSLKELTKTEERLKEVLAILRERTSYLNNLERERQQALRFKKLEKDVKRYKASIIYSDLYKKRKELEKVNSDISNKNKQIDKIRKILIDIERDMEKARLKINSIDSKIEKSTGLEREKLNQEIANFRAELAGLNVKIENYENKLFEMESQKKEFQELIKNNENSINELKKEPITLSRKKKDIELKKQELEKIEEQKRKFYMIKSELNSVKQRLKDKKSLLENYSNESDFLLKQIEQISNKLFDKRTNNEKVNELKISLKEKKRFLEESNGKESEIKKISYTNEYEIKKQEKLKETISKIDICPICKSKITKEHSTLVNKEINEKLSKLKQEIKNKDKELNDIKNGVEKLNEKIKEINSEIFNRESDLIKFSDIEGKTEQIKNIQKKIDILKKEILELDNNKNHLVKTFNKDSNIEQRYETLMIEVQEISLRSKENVSSEISFKQKELERSKISLKQLLRNIDDLNQDLEINIKERENDENTLEWKKEQERELNKKFQKLISERDELHKGIRENELKVSENQNLIHNKEQEINLLSIEKARINAEIENFEIDMLDFNDVQIIKAKKDSLIEKLERTKEILLKIGTVNLLSLEVYDSIKKEYDLVKEKTNIIEKEKEDILKIISEIDLKKKKTFMKTLISINEKFSKNFSSLSNKGIVSLEVENKKDPFKEGVNILIKTGHGKYFDATSLSGGEQTLIALSLIFAIQELKPYCFYMLDEIDAALDKRNSERLATLLKKYMQKGQYIIITHNDQIITNASNIYGVSMHEGISKIVSMKI